MSLHFKGLKTHLISSNAQRVTTHQSTHAQSTDTVPRRLVSRRRCVMSNDGASVLLHNDDHISYLVSIVFIWLIFTRRSDICYHISVCRLSVRNVRALYSWVETFGNICSPPCTVAIL